MALINDSLFMLSKIWSAQHKCNFLAIQFSVRVRIQLYSLVTIREGTLSS